MLGLDGKLSRGFRKVQGVLHYICIYIYIITQIYSLRPTDESHHIFHHLPLAFLTMLMLNILGEKGRGTLYLMPPQSNS